LPLCTGSAPGCIDFAFYATLQIGIGIGAVVVVEIKIVTVNCAAIVQKPWFSCEYFMICTRPVFHPFQQQVTRLLTNPPVCKNERANGTVIV